MNAPGRFVMLALLAAAGCGGESIRGRTDAGDAGILRDVSVPIPYDAWPSNNGCWYVPSVPACGCRVDPGHSMSGHDYGAHCDGTRCTCYLDHRSTLSAPQVPGECDGSRTPAFDALWSMTCGFP